MVKASGLWYAEFSATDCVKGGRMMNITGISTGLSNIDLKSDVGIAVLSKEMDTNEALGQGLIEMIDVAAMERSVNPNVGANFDMRV